MNKKNFDEKTIQEQKAWEYYKSIEKENYQLKKKLENAEEEIKNLHKVISYWKESYRKLTGKKQPKGIRDKENIRDY